MARGARLAVVVLVAVVCRVGGTACADDVVIPAGREAEVIKVIAPYGLEDEVADGFRIKDMRIDQRRIDVVLDHRDEPAERVTLALTVRPGPPGSGYDLSVEPPEEQQSPPARRAVAKLRDTIVRNADGAFWGRVLGASTVGGSARGDTRPNVVTVPAVFVVVAALCAVLGIVLLGHGSTRPWTAYLAVAATVACVPFAMWLVTRTIGIDDPGALAQYRQGLQRECARAALWVAFGAAAAACVVTLEHVASRQGRAATAAAARVVLDALGVLVWSVIVRFVLTEPNIMTDGGSGYGRLWRMQVGGYQGFAVLVESVFPEPRFMWTVIRLPWILAALAPPLVLLLARAWRFGRGAALLAGIALASIPLHAAMYASDFEFGPVLTFDLLGLALVAAAVRFERDELAAAGAAVLAYVSWCRPEGPIVGAAAMAIAAPALWRWHERPVLVASLGWLVLNAAASFASTRVLGGGGQFCLDHPFESEFPVRTFLSLQPVVPFWLVLPLPFGVVRLVRNDRWRLAVIAVGTTVGLLPLAVTALCHVDQTRTYMEFFRYGTWALPWLVLLAAEGMEAVVAFVATRLGGIDPRARRRVEIAATGAIIATCMATPVVFHDYLARQYGPRVEEDAFRKALQRVPSGCGVVVPDDASDDQGGGTIEIMQRYVYIAEEAAARRESAVNPRGVVGVTPFVRSAEHDHALPPLPSDVTGSPDRAAPCWYYFRGSYCATGLFGEGSAACTNLEQRASLEPVLTQPILYISHRLVTRPDLRDPPLYDPAQPLVLSKLVGWHAAGAPATASR